MNCKTDCTGNEPGFVCIGGNAFSASICNSVCSDNIITYDEQCEDGDNMPNDGCSGTCQLEVGF